MEQRRNAKLVPIIALVVLVVVVAGALFAYNAALAGGSAKSQVAASSQSAASDSAPAASQQITASDSAPAASQSDASAGSSQSASSANASAASPQGESGTGVQSESGTGAQSESGTGAQSESGTGAQDMSAAYSLLTVSDPEGSSITLGELAKDKVTVVNVWATWCPYCVDEMQDFQALYDKYGDKIQFVMLDSADSESEVSKAHDYVVEQGFTFPVFYDDSWKVQMFFNVTAYPTTIVIDADGTLLSNRPGRIDASLFDEALASLV